MHRKKFQALLVAGLLTIGVIGGTLAWFTSQDNVTNIFNTGSTNDPTNPDAGIDIVEKFPGAIENTETGEWVYDNPILPGDTIIKEVSVTSTADYDQFLRAKITKVWKINMEQKATSDAPALAKGTAVTHYKVLDGKVIYNTTGEAGWKPLDNNKIQLNFSKFSKEEGNSWSENQGDATSPAIGYYYFNAILKGSKTEPGGHKFPKTVNLLESVTFVKGDDAVDNIYKNITFDVKVDAEGIQATNGAGKDAGWSDMVVLVGFPGYGF